MKFMAALNKAPAVYVCHRKEYFCLSVGKHVTRGEAARYPQERGTRKRVLAGRRTETERKGEEKEEGKKEENKGGNAMSLLLVHSSVHRLPRERSVVSL